MPAGGRIVNASVCTTRDRSNYLVKSRASSFPTPRANLQRMSIIPVVRGIFLTRRRSNYYAGQNLLSLFFPHTENDASILQTFGEYVGTRRRSKTIDHSGHSRALYFLPCRAQEELLSRKSFVEFGKWVAADLLFASAIDASACLESFSGNDLILLIKTNEKKLKFKLSKSKLFRKSNCKLRSRIKIYHLRKIILKAAPELLSWLIELYLLQNLVMYGTICTDFSYRKYSSFN